MPTLKSARCWSGEPNPSVPAPVLLRTGNASVVERLISPIRSREDPVKLLRTICLDASDSFVFEKPAEPGEWAVSGAFAFAHCNPANLKGKARTVCRAGFLGLGSLGRSTLAQIVEASEIDRRDVVEMLAALAVAQFGAPYLATAPL